MNDSFLSGIVRYFFVDYNGNCFAILETGPLKSKEVVAKGFSYGSSFSPNGRWNLAWARSETTMTRYGNEAYLIFNGRNEVDSFVSRLNKAIEWKNRNREQGNLLVPAPPRKRSREHVPASTLWPLLSLYYLESKAVEELSVALIVKVRALRVI